MQWVANSPFLSGFLCSGLLSVAPYCARGGIRVVSGGVVLHRLLSILLLPQIAYCGASQDRGQLEDHVLEGDPEVEHSPPHHGPARVLEDALPYRLQDEAPVKLRGFDFSFMFYSRAAPFLVEPRGFEPLTSAVQRRQDTLLALSGVCKIAAQAVIFT